MISRDSNYSEIFEIFAEQMGADFLTKEAAFELPPETLDAIKSDELDVGLADVVAASHGPKLYGVTSETGDKLVGQAHPGGGTKIDFGSNDKELGKVETIVEQHKRNQDIATRMPKGKIASLVGKLAKLADVMDEAGFGEDADKIEGVMDALSATAAKKMTAPKTNPLASWMGPPGVAEANKNNGQGLSMEDVDAEIEKKLSPGSPEIVMGKPTVINEPAPEPIKWTDQHQKMNDWALAELNRYLQSAGHQPVSAKEMPAALAQMGVKGYGNWKQLFQMLHEKGPAWVQAVSSRNVELPAAKLDVERPARPNPTQLIDSAEKNRRAPPGYAGVAGYNRTHPPEA